MNSYGMAPQPTLLRTSAPSEAEVLITRITERARRLTTRELADALECSTSTAGRRRHGHGWTVVNWLMLSCYLGIRPSAFVAEQAPR